MIFLSSQWHARFNTTSQIRDFSMDLTNSCPIYLLHTLSPLNYILSYLISGNRKIVTISLTLTLIDREISSLSGNNVLVTPKPNSNKETQ